MQTALLLSLLAAATATKFNEPAINKFMVENINMKTDLWEAHESPRFEGVSKDEVKHMCGTFIDPAVVVGLPVKEHTASELADSVPSEFDSRTQWPECPMIGYARDQSNCGSCWAFASTEAFNDRLCIASKGKFSQFLSTEHTVSCCGFLQCFSMGCNGGQPGMAWNWFKSHGVVSGGNNDQVGKGDTCLPYHLASCAHHVTDPTRPGCDKIPTGAALSCMSSCSEKNYATPFSSDVHKADTSYSLSGVENIQRDIMQYGSVSAAFTVYEDFPAYKSGVYHYTTGSALGGHAVKIVGWGVDAATNTPYWTVMNSWNSGWGDNGSFKIKRGSDECGIESMGVNGGHVSYSAPAAKLR